MEKKYIARITIEAATPFFIGSGVSSINTDALIQRDYLGLPIIQGTSITGLLRHILENQNIENRKIDDSSNEINWFTVFGNNGTEEAKKLKQEFRNLGSRIKIGTARSIVDGKVIESIDDYNSLNWKNFSNRIFDNLPNRQHVRINEKGAAVNQGLFNNEIVYKGMQFSFDIEMMGDDVSPNEDNQIWKTILSTFHHPLFRIGSGTRNGYGKVSVIKIEHKIFDLTDIKEFDEYVNHDHQLNSELKGFKLFSKDLKYSELLKFQLKVKPQDFFIFGSGFVDQYADATPLKEDVLIHGDNETKLVSKFLIPATSIKGALAHRTLYHFNKLNEMYIIEKKGVQESNSLNVNELFGMEAGGEEAANRGFVISDDVFLDEEKVTTYHFNHVAIDRFTGGAIDGALFNEQVCSYKKDIIFDFYVEENRLQDVNGQKLIQAFELALLDVAEGMLGLGGMTTKGHGYFEGIVTKNNQKVSREKDYEKS